MKGYRYRPVGFLWVFIYIMYMIGVVSTVCFFSFAWLIWQYCGVPCLLWQGISEHYRVLPKYYERGVPYVQGCQKAYF